MSTYSVYWIPQEIIPQLNGIFSIFFKRHHDQLVFWTTSTSHLNVEFQSIVIRYYKVVVFALSWTSIAFWQHQNLGSAKFKWNYSCGIIQLFWENTRTYFITTIYHQTQPSLRPHVHILVDTKVSVHKYNSISLAFGVSRQTTDLMKIIESSIIW